MKIPILFVLSFIPIILLSQPWGKDADLAIKHKIENPLSGCNQNPSLLAQFGRLAIKFHQDVISPADGPRSHFIPSSSQYTLDAIQKYGFFVGVSRGCDRLMRENDDPWFYRTTLDPQGHPMKWDPLN